MYCSEVCIYHIPKSRNRRLGVFLVGLRLLCLFFFFFLVLHSETLYCTIWATLPENLRAVRYRT